MRRAASLVLGAAMLVAAAVLAFVAVRGPAPPRTLDERVHAVAATLRCPVCQDLSVADSPSSVARQMRSTIASELRAGESPSRIRSGFVRAYGTWILLAPPRRGIDLIAWVAPALVALGGLVVLVAAVRRWTFGAAPAGLRDRGAGAAPDGEAGEWRSLGSSLTAEDRRLLDRALAATPDEVVP